MTPRPAFSLRLAACAAAIAWFAVPGPRADNRGAIALEFLGRHATGVFDDGASEIAAHDPVTQRLSVVNAATATVDVHDIHDPATPAFAFSIDVAGVPASGTAGDLGPEGLVVITAEHSPTGEPLLMLANEVSGSTSIFRVRKAD